jgi:hypothetical protein
MNYDFQAFYPRGTFGIVRLSSTAFLTDERLLQIPIIFVLYHAIPYPCKKMRSRHVHIKTPIMQTPESKKEEFRKYLEKSGVVDAMTKVLVGLYEEPDRPPNAIDYVKKYLGTSSSVSAIDYEAIRAENEKLKAELKDMKATIEELKEALKEARED